MHVPKWSKNVPEHPIKISIIRGKKKQNRL